jgi:outer membrane protein assembly factor BamB
MKLLFGTCILLVLSTNLSVADWPQWRGPDRNGLSKETDLLKSWPAGGPKRVWTFDKAGLGYSGPAIVAGKLYTLGARRGSEELIAVDANSGKELWSAKVGEILKNDWGDGPRGTPTVDGDHVYAMGGRGDLICATAADGKVVWRRAMRDFGGRTPDWGYTASVLVDGNKVVCTPGGQKGAIVALDKKTGEVIWQSKDFTDSAHYASLIAANHGGNDNTFNSLRSTWPVFLPMRKIAGVRLARQNRGDSHADLSRWSCLCHR